MAVWMYPYILIGIVTRAAVVLINISLSSISEWRTYETFLLQNRK